DRLPRFDDIIFHEKLGTQAERIERIAQLTTELAPLVGADVEKAKTAALLCKCDLLTEVVGEFPEVQGTMGKYYAQAQGEDEAVAHAIEDHYRPKGPDDLVPADPVAIAVALADKLDVLMGFWIIDEKPTGSKDPYALRGAARGIVRLILENGLRLKLLPIFETTAGKFPPQLPGEEKTAAYAAHLLSQKDGHYPRSARYFAINDLLSFFTDRLKVQLREQGARHDLVDAVLAQHGEGHDDLVLIVRRVESLGKFLGTDDGKSLLAGVKRASNILRIEEKKDGVTYHGRPHADLYLQPEERELAAAIHAAKEEAAKAVAKEDFEHAMAVIAKLRPYVDAF